MYTASEVLFKQAQILSDAYSPVSAQHKSPPHHDDICQCKHFFELSAAMHVVAVKVYSVVVRLWFL